MLFLKLPANKIGFYLESGLLDLEQVSGQNINGNNIY